MRWGIVPVPTPDELRDFAEFTGLSASQNRLADVEDGLAVVTRMLIGEGVGVRVTDTARGMRAIRVMAHVLISRSEGRRVTYLAGRPRSLADRLERVLDRRARQRLMSWYWATVLTAPPVMAFSASAASVLEAWVSDSGDAPELVRTAQAYLASDEFRLQISGRASRPHRLVLEAILSRQGARDFYTGELISVRRLFEPKSDEPDVQFHHVVPKEWPRVKELRLDLQEQVRRGLANLTPLADATNGTIKNRAPAIYLGRFGETDPSEREEGINAMLRQHLIEPDLLWAIDNDVADLEDRVERFLNHRLDAIVAAFGRLVGGEHWGADVSSAAAS